MNKLFYVLLIGCSCSNNINKGTNHKNEMNQILSSGKRFYIEDTTQYSSEFIKDLKSLDNVNKSLKLVGKDLIINDSDTTTIPVDLPLNEAINYKSEDRDHLYNLVLKRTNYTKIEYEFSVNDTLIQSGKAILSGSFMFGAEFSEITDGEVIALTQYFDSTNCWTCIKIESDTGKRVEFEMNCTDDKLKKFENIPILIAE